MIEENAIVAKIEHNQVWVESKPKQGCGGCLQKSSCSTSVLDKFIKKRSIAVDCDIEIKAGDEVVIGISEGVLIKASLLLYMLPLLVMVLCGAVAEAFLPSGYEYADLAIAGAAISALLLSLWAISKLHQSFFYTFFSRPVVIRRAAD